MAKKVIPLIKRVLNNETGQIEWQAIEPDQLTSWVAPKRVSHNLMRRAQMHAYKLNFIERAKK